MGIRPYFRQRVRNAATAAAKRPAATCFAFAGTVLVGAGVVIAVPESALLDSSADAAATASTYAPDMDSLLDARSPGGRRYGWLLNSKQERPGFAPAPTERVLPSGRRRPVPGNPIAPPAVPVAPVVGLPGTTAVPGTTGPLGTPAPIPAPGGVGGPPFAGGGVLPGPIGSPGGGNPDNPDTGNPTNPNNPTPETPVPAVPEPATWAMLILGFATLGSAMRRRRSLLAACPQ